MIAGGVLTGASGVSGLLQVSSLVQQAQDALTSLSARENAWWLGPVTLTFTSVVVTGLWLWMAWKNHRGRTWARTLASAFNVLHVVGGVRLLASRLGDNVSLSPDRQVESVAVLIIAVTVFVLVWLPSSSAFYTAARRQSLTNGPQP
ncbi:MAG: hypothetical protein JWO93_587 [Micrococcaceae bacterium]|nr:hypothetical protein [Micrococcaceae bacterium]